MSKHLIYAVVENRGGYKKVGDKFESDPSLICHYIKRFSDKETFYAWCKMSTGPDGHLSVIKHWTDRPPCAELQAIKKQYTATWSDAKW